MIEGDSNPLKALYIFKQNSFLLKLVVFSLFLAFTIHFFSSYLYSINYSVPVLNNNSSHEDHVFNSDKGSLSLNTSKLIEKEEKPKCDLFKGEWIKDKSGPVYNNNSCPFIEHHQNCMSNGRPDSDYLYWKWSPFDCKLPKFNPERFLYLMRNKSWAFIGDSISRNHVQSLLCILYQVEPAKEIYHDEEYKSKTWFFPSYNFTLAVIWSPFLIKAEIFEDNDGVSTAETQLYLDKLDEIWTSRYNDFDYAIIAGGKWFLKSAIYYENDTILGCHHCHEQNLTEIGFDHAYHKALGLVLNFVLSSSHKTRVFLRTITPDHFENGEWFSGGTCDRRVPFKEGQVNMTDIDKILYEVELEEYNKIVGVGLGQGGSVKLLDTTRLSLLRPDGHPGPYRQAHPFAKDKNAKVQYDCLHWCLPGPIDLWNDIIMDILMND
ncbi:protein trichome birefringence-like 24 [Amaranthus tricolor]|uniref:protein trichome birefringence-like 24 n=1 Tax=Amaranthus tricolor TaxID=29722 RepID=UPI00258EEC69|nr:protein trichome birefringence-like 24 [Amaranthus tricolor]